MLSPVSKSISIYYQENLSPFFFVFVLGEWGRRKGVASFLVPILHDFSYNVNVKSVVFFFFFFFLYLYFSLVIFTVTYAKTKFISLAGSCNCISSPPDDIDKLYIKYKFIWYDRTVFWVVEFYIKSVVTGQQND